MRFRPGHRQQQRILAAQFNADTGTQDAMRAKLADPSVPEHVKQGIRNRFAWADSVKPAKKRRPAGSSGEPLEADVQKACIELLLAHPRVSKVIRFNSGAVHGESETGKRYFVRFASEPVPDIYFFGPSVWGWLEVKRPGWTRPKDERENRQARFLDDVRVAGGIGRFITDPQQIMEALKSDGQQF